MENELEMTTKMMGLLRHMVHDIVDNPKETIINARWQGEKELVLDLTVSADDQGKVIGKQGRTARSMRTILCATAAKLGISYQLNIAEVAAVAKEGSPE